MMVVPDVTKNRHEEATKSFRVVSTPCAKVHLFSNSGMHAWTELLLLGSGIRCVSLRDVWLLSILG